LRSYHKKPVYFKNDLFRKTQTFIQKEVKPVLEEKTKKQRVLSARLSTPKYVNRKYEYSSEFFR
jgi:hypothetical protein